MTLGIIGLLLALFWIIGRRRPSRASVSTEWLRQQDYDRSGWEGPTWNFAHRDSYRKR